MNAAMLMGQAAAAIVDMINSGQPNQYALA
jgi:hypothetical protein